MISVVNSLHFVLPSEVWKLPPVLTYEVVSECGETFRHSRLPPWGTYPCPEILSLSLSLFKIFPLPH